MKMADRYLLKTSYHENWKTISSFLQSQLITIYLYSSW